MRFLRKLRGGVADHDMDGEMTVVWAHGQLDTFYQEDQVSEELGGVLLRAVNRTFRNFAVPIY